MAVVAIAVPIYTTDLRRACPHTCTLYTHMYMYKATFSEIHVTYHQLKNVWLRMLFHFLHHWQRIPKNTCAVRMYTCQGTYMYVYILNLKSAST